MVKGEVLIGRVECGGMKYEGLGMREEGLEDRSKG